MNAETLLAKIRKDLDESEISSLDSGLDAEAMVAKYAIPALNNLKDVQSGLYADFFLDESGWQRKVKNKVIRKIANVARNTVEIPLMRQQKFNDNVTAVLEYLFSENKKLHERIKELETKK
jgi:hypothetical protein